MVMWLNYLDIMYIILKLNLINITGNLLEEENDWCSCAEKQLK